MKNSFFLFLAIVAIFLTSCAKEEEVNASSALILDRMNPPTETCPTWTVGKNASFFTPGLNSPFQLEFKDTLIIKNGGEEFNSKNILIKRGSSFAIELVTEFPFWGNGHDIIQMSVAPIGDIADSSDMLVHIGLHNMNAHFYFVGHWSEKKQSLSFKKIPYFTLVYKSHGKIEFFDKEKVVYTLKL
jgi:hypothetical protein